MIVTQNSHEKKEKLAPLSDLKLWSINKLLKTWQHVDTVLLGKMDNVWANRGLLKGDKAEQGERWRPGAG